MPPRCWLAQSDGAHGGLTSPPSMRKFQRVCNLPASPSRWTLVQYRTGPMSALGQKQTCAPQKGSFVEPSKITVVEFVRSRVDQWEASGKISATVTLSNIRLRHSLAQ